MILGFTGTRAGLTSAQRAVFMDVVTTFPDRFLHGGAVGADEEADAFLGLVCPVEVYPASVERAVYWRGRPEPRLVHQVLSPLYRNRVIARRCDHLLATPREMNEQQRGGTWTTVRYARRAGKSVTLLLPDGTVREECGGGR